jgi:hypothetical protein
VCVCVCVCVFVYLFASCVCVCVCVSLFFFFVCVCVCVCVYTSPVTLHQYRGNYLVLVVYGGLNKDALLWDRHFAAYANAYTQLRALGADLCAVFPVSEFELLERPIVKHLREVPTS